MSPAKAEPSSRIVVVLKVFEPPPQEFSKWAEGTVKRVRFDESATYCVDVCYGHIDAFQKTVDAIVAADTCAVVFKAGFGSCLTIASAGGAVALSWPGIARRRMRQVFVAMSSNCRVLVSGVAADSGIVTLMRSVGIDSDEDPQVREDHERVKKRMTNDVVDAWLSRGQAQPLGSDGRIVAEVFEAVTLLEGGFVHRGMDCPICPGFSGVFADVVGHVVVKHGFSARVMDECTTRVCKYCGVAMGTEMEDIQRHLFDAHQSELFGVLRMAAQQGSAWLCDAVQTFCRVPGMEHGQTAAPQPAAKERAPPAAVR